MAPLVSIDQTGDYDRFLAELEAREGHVQPGQIRFLVEAATTSPVLVPRRMNGTAVHPNLAVEEKDFDVIQGSLDQTHQTIAQLLQQRITQNGFYVIHGMDQVAYLVPAPKDMSGNLPAEEYKPLGIANDAPAFSLILPILLSLSPKSLLLRGLQQRSNLVLDPPRRV